MSKDRIHDCNYDYVFSHESVDIKQKLGKRVKELRLIYGYSQDYLSSKCNLNRTYIVGIENGKRNVSIQNIEKISSAFDLSLTEFFDSDIFNGN